MRGGLLVSWHGSRFGYLTIWLAAYLPIIWLDGGLAGWRDGYLAGYLAGAGYLACCGDLLAGWLIGWWLVRCLPATDSRGWQAGYRAGYLAGWLHGWLAGDLAIWLAAGWLSSWLAALAGWLFGNWLCGWLFDY